MVMSFIIVCMYVCMYGSIVLNKCKIGVRVLIYLLKIGFGQFLKIE